jgi:hypothetical protein
MKPSLFQIAPSIQTMSEKYYLRHFMSHNTIESMPHLLIAVLKK